MSKGFDRIALLETFIRIAERGSLSAAARDLGVTQPTISRQLAALESEMNAVLAHRTTHELTLTSDGRTLLADAHRFVRDWQMIADRSQSDQDFRGAIRVVAPIALGQTLLARLGARFLVKHPKVTLHWHVTDDSIRFAEEGCDCWFRVGPVPDTSLVVRQVAKVERIVVAAPQLSCDSLEELVELPWVSLAPYEANKIELTGSGGEAIGFETSPRLHSDNILTLLESVRAGIGAAIMPRWLVADQIEAGELIEPLVGVRASALPVHVALPPGMRRPAKVDALVEEISAGLVAAV